MLKMKQFRGYSRIWHFSHLFLELLKLMKRKLTVGLEPTTAGLEVQRAIQLRHASLFRRDVSLQQKSHFYCPQFPILHVYSIQ